MEKARLHYSILFRRLWGTAGGGEIALWAWSGGRGGSTTPGAVERGVANNPFQIGRKTNHAKGIHGGPLPIGRYRIAVPSVHEHLGLSAELTPLPGGLTLGMLDRDGFFIHGRGPHGSDGCIVPYTAVEFQRIMQALKKSGGGELQVWP